MNRLDKKLFQFIRNHKNIKIKEQSIRNAINRIRTNNPGLTINAAAYIFALNKGFKVMRFLTGTDRKSLQNNIISYKPVIQSNIRKTIKFTPTKPSFGDNFINEANKNAKVYPYIYILGNSLRTLILNTFSGVPNWWNTKVSKDIQQYAEKIKIAEKKHDWLPKRGNHPIYYIGLYELYRIIDRNISFFKSIFTDSGNFRTWINEIVPIRNLIAHNVKIRKEEQQNVIIRTKYICTQIERNMKPHP